MINNENLFLSQGKDPFDDGKKEPSFFDILFGNHPIESNKPSSKASHDEYDWDDPDNCSDREYMDDDDYDDFDN